MTLAIAPVKIKHDSKITFEEWFAQFKQRLRFKLAGKNKAYGYAKTVLDDLDEGAVKELYRRGVSAQVAAITYESDMPHSSDPELDPPAKQKVTVPKYKPHPLSEINPMMSDDEFDAHLLSLQANGLLDDIDLFEGMILDGRNRYRGCIKLGIVPHFKQFNGTWEDARDLVIARMARRNPDQGQLACSAALMLPFFENEADSRRKRGVSALLREGYQGKSSALAAKLVGVSERYVEQAKWLLQANRELFDKVHRRQMRLPQAARAVFRIQKENILRAKASKVTGKPQWKFQHIDAIKFMEEQPSASINLIFADPRYNIGVDYGFGAEADRTPWDDYYAWCKRWMEESYRLLRPNGSLWVLIDDNSAAEFKMMLKGAGFAIRRWVKWYETFGLNNTTDDNFNKTSRHLFYCAYSDEQFTFNASEVRRESDRIAKYNDKRADPWGKILDDVWNIPRLVDNAPERVPGFPTQLPLDLLRPIVRACSDPGDLIFDPFSGSGTTAAAAIESGRRFIGTDINADYVELADVRLKAMVAGL